MKNTKHEPVILEYHQFKKLRASAHWSLPAKLLLPAFLSLFLGFCGGSEKPQVPQVPQDTDGDGIEDALDVDDDNDGLIELGTAIELNNIRFDLAGHSYDDEEDDAEGNEGLTTGAPTNPTEICNEETSEDSGVYLCGYELTADIDLDGNDQNSEEKGNINPISKYDADNRFTAIFEGNEHTIRNLNIDTTDSLVANDDRTNDASLFGYCHLTIIQNVTLENPTIQARRIIGSLCSYTDRVIIRNVHISGGSVQSENSATFGSQIGGLVGSMIGGRVENSSAGATVSSGGAKGKWLGGLIGATQNGAQITGSSASGNVSNGADGGNSMGGLVGRARNNTTITDSSASGNISDGGMGGDQMGGLVGYAPTNVTITDSSASGNVSNGGDGGDAMGGLVGVLSNSNIANCKASGNVSDGGMGSDLMGGLVGYAPTNVTITGSSASGNVSGGMGTFDIMGGLVGLVQDNITITNSSTSGNVSNGGDGSDTLGGLVGLAINNSTITGSSAGGDVSDGGADNDFMGGLVGYVQVNSNITNSSASGNVFDGGAGDDLMGGFTNLGSSGNDNSWIVGSSSSGNVSDGGDDPDQMGGFIGRISPAGFIRDSFSSGRVCDGVLSGNNCSAGKGSDRIGAFAGRLYGQGTSSSFTAKPEVHNCLAVGKTDSNTSDVVGFFGEITYGTSAEIQALVTQNHFDITTTGLDATNGRGGSLPGDPDDTGTLTAVTDNDLTGITGSATNALQVTAAYTGWSAVRWHFAAGSYPEAVYFDFDPANPTTDSPTGESTIDVCEDIDSNDPMLDEGSADMPDCGDILSAFPRPAS